MEESTAVVDDVDDAVSSEEQREERSEHQGERREQEGERSEQQGERREQEGERSEQEGETKEEGEGEEKPSAFDKKTKASLVRVIGKHLTSHFPDGKLMLAQFLGFEPVVETEEQRVAKIVAQANTVPLEAVGSGIRLGFFTCSTATIPDEIRAHVASLHPDKYDRADLVELYEGHSAVKFNRFAVGLQFTLYGCIGIGQQQKPKEMRSTLRRRQREFRTANSSRLAMRTFRHRSRSPKNWSAKAHRRSRSPKKWSAEARRRSRSPKGATRRKPPKLRLSQSPPKTRNKHRRKGQRRRS